MADRLLGVEREDTVLVQVREFGVGGRVTVGIQLRDLGGPVVERLPALLPPTHESSGADPCYLRCLRERRPVTERHDDLVAGRLRVLRHLPMLDLERLKLGGLLLRCFLRPPFLLRLALGQP